MGLTHGFGLKMAIFFNFFFQAILARKMSLPIFQNEKTPFQAIKTRSQKSRKVDIFPKGLTHGFGPKIAIFPTFFLGNIGQQNVFFDILERKHAFLGYKKNKFQKWKNSHFFNGVNPWFWSKSGLFSNFFCQAIQARKSCFTIFQNEKTLFQAIKTRNSKRLKIDIFPIELTHGFSPKKAIFSICFSQYRPEKCFYDILERQKRLSRL